MVDAAGPSASSERSLLVRYWAGARAAAGVAEERYPVPATLAALIDEIVARHRDRPHLKDVVAVCSVLVGDRPVSSTDPAEVPLAAGDTVELLPPFAGG